MREQPNYKADLVQRSSIATAVTVRTGRKVTSGEVKSVARHLGIDAITKGDHEKYYTKLQAIGITEALMHKVKLEMEARTAAAPAAPPAPTTPPFIEGAGGKVGPRVKVKGPSGDVPTEEEVKALPAATPEPKKKPRGSTGPKSKETRDKMSARRNKSGAVQVYNIIRDLPITGAEARKLLVTAGINVFADAAHRANIAREDFAKAEALLMEACEGRPAKDAAHGVIRPLDSAPEISDADKALLKELAHEPKPLPKSPVIPPPPTDDEIVKAVEDRALWLRCLESCPGFSDTLLHNVLVKRHFYYTPTLEELRTKAPDPVFPEGSAPAGLSDQQLADELRARGYTVTATKHIEL